MRASSEIGSTVEMYCWPSVSPQVAEALHVEEERLVVGRGAHVEPVPEQNAWTLDALGQAHPLLLVRTARGVGDALAPLVGERADLVELGRR